jgi:hypothetical protein
MHSFSPYSVPVTDCSGQGLTHQVYDLHLCSHTSGPLPTVCGSAILPAPMASPIGRPCPECEARIGYLDWDGNPARTRIRHRLPSYLHAVRRHLLPHSSRARVGVTSV